ncbi:MAG: GxxExxY protein [Anaerolineae bacterium]|nr:GxxExxY protein [Anaerolineae bacterium]
MADPLTEKIIGAAIEVHRHLGAGLLESIYEDALCVEFGLRGISYKRQVPIDVVYKDHVLKGQRLDLLVEDEVVVELKAVTRPQTELIMAQLLSYLYAANLSRGLIINFSVKRLVDGVTRVFA